MINTKTYTVYIHTNKCNGKKYVGATSRPPCERFAKGTGYKLNTEFYADIQKYGWDGFEHNLIYKDISKEEAHLKEQELIKSYQTTDSEFGYNKRRGGIIPKTLKTKDGREVRTIPVVLDEEVYNQIRILAKKHHRSMSAEIRVALEFYISNNL